MTATSLGLSGPVKFLGAYVKHVSSSLGLSVNPSNVSVTLVEDVAAGVLFTYPKVGGFYTLEVGPNWKFSGVLTRYEVDVANIGGRSIRVSLNDAREVMQNAPIILAPGSQTIVDRIAATQCSVIDIFGCFNVGAVNLSGWNESGMPVRNIIKALTGGSMAFGSSVITIPRQTLKAFGETYRFDLSALEDVVDLDYRVNTNLVSLSNLIEEIAARSAFDWYVDAERAADGIIDVTIRIIDRSVDNVDIGLSEILADNTHRVISATSGVELRNELSCMVLQGAPVEQMQKVEIVGLANEPIDLVPESGSAAYIMSEDEMRVVLAGRHAWEVWLSIPTSHGGGGGLKRYGGTLKNEYLRGVTGEDATKLLEKIKNKNLVKHPERVVNNYIDNINAGHILAGKIYEKLKGHAEASYGKRFVHNDVFDEIIDSCWTRDVVEGDNDPYEHFRQQDGRTRAFVEFVVQGSGNVLELGISSLTASFGNQPVFRNVTSFGKTFERAGLGDNLIEAGAVLVLENSTVDLSNIVINMDKTAYTFNKAATSLFCACTIDKDGVVRIESPILEAKPTSEELISMLVSAAESSSPTTTFDRQIAALEETKANIRKQIAEQQELMLNGTKNQQSLAKSRLEVLQARQEAIDARIAEIKRRKEISAKVVGGATDADGNEQSSARKLIENIKRIYTPGSFEMHSKCYQPKYVYIPTRSRYNRYGPVFPSNLTPFTEGRLEIVQDDGFAPWEFGGLSLMQEAMQLKVDSAISHVREVFSGTIVVEGFPKYSLGDALEKNANINNISIAFGDGGVTTTYNLQTFTRKFGQFTKEDWTRLAIFANAGGARLLPKRLISFVENHRTIVNRQFTGRGSAGGNPTTGGAGYLG